MSAVQLQVLILAFSFCTGIRYILVVLHYHVLI